MGGVTINNNEKYFVSLISSHLNKSEPDIPDGIDWNEIYRLSNIHNICAIVTSQILLLPKELQPQKEILSKFRQQMGYSLIGFDEKEKALNLLRKLFTDNEIDYMFVKGAIIKEYYPVKEFRTSGDIDAVVRIEQLHKVKAALVEKGLPIKSENAQLIVTKCFGQEIEIHSNEDYDNEYFKNIFDLASKNGFEYRLNDEAHLLYVLCHIIKHFNAFGAGIKMFADIDVLIRKINNFDYEKFISICNELNISTFAKSSFSLCNYWFNTPVSTEIDFNKSNDFRELFEGEIINSGTFGFNKRNLGDYYINKGIGENSKNNFAAKIRALFKLVFPGADTLKRSFEYCKKHPILLPIAWINRVFIGIFKRGGHSMNTVNSILNTGEETLQYKKLLDELEI